MISNQNARCIVYQTTEMGWVDSISQTYISMDYFFLMEISCCTGIFKSLLVEGCLLRKGCHKDRLNKNLSFT